MNRDNVRRLIEYLDTTRARKFSTAYYLVSKAGFQIGYIENVPPKTEDIETGDLAGIIVIAFRNEITVEKPYETINSAAARWLGLDQRASEELFSGEWSKDKSKITMKSYAAYLYTRIKNDEKEAARALLNKKSKPKVEA